MNIVPATLVLLLSAAVLPAAVAGDYVNCKDLGKAAAVNASFPADEAAKQAALQQHTAERLNRIDAQAKALIKAGAWTDADRQAYFARQRASGAYSKLEKQKSEALFSAQYGRDTAKGIKDSNPPGACSYALSTLSAYDDLRNFTDTQYDMLEAGINDVAKSKNVSLPP